MCPFEQEGDEHSRLRLCLLTWPGDLIFATEALLFTTGLAYEMEGREGRNGAQFCRLRLWLFIQEPAVSRNRYRLMSAVC